MRALPPAALQPLRALGWPLPLPLEARCIRAAAGAAQRHCALTAPWDRELRAMREEHGSLADLVAAASDSGIWRALQSAPLSLGAGTSWRAS